MMPVDIQVEDSDSRSVSEVGTSPKRHALVLENSNGCSTQPSHGDHDTLAAGSKAIQGQKSATSMNVTQLKEAPKARVSFASARTTPNITPFVPLNPASILRGFQEGGVSSKKGTYIMPMNNAKTVKLILLVHRVQLIQLST
jgi:hypothetical protein